jgi:hypothetical protein
MLGRLASKNALSAKRVAECRNIVLVQLTKKIETASRWIEVHAENPREAMMLAEAKAKSPASIVLTATEVRATK